MFSMVVVCLNAGESLLKTVQSILMQTYKNYEIIIKDGLSFDGSIEKLPADEKIHVYREKDRGIYDAMNQALEKVTGEYVYFLNCGDLLYNKDVLQKVNLLIEANTDKTKEKDNVSPGTIFYGNIYERITKEIVVSNPHIDAFACYRNVPCHQACFYGSRLMDEKKFNIKYVVRADYEHFLWCYFSGNADMIHLPFLVADYEGGGFSETNENRSKSKNEHKEITEMYMKKGQVLKYKAIMLLTLAPIRTWLSRNRVTSHFYNWMKKNLYR